MYVILFDCVFETFHIVKSTDNYFLVKTSQQCILHATAVHVLLNYISYCV